MLRVECLKWERAGLEVVERSEADIDRSSPRRHCPQKASNAQVAMATSRGLVRSSPSKRCWSMATVIGGCGGFLEEEGARFLALLMTTCRCKPPFQGALWALCHALRPERRFWMLLAETCPASEAAYAQSMNSSAGNYNTAGTCSCLQKARKCLMCHE
jgi:hypothetical protein